MCANPKDRINAAKTTQTAPRRGRMAAWLAVVAAACLLSTCGFVVSETESAFVERLGQITAVYDMPADRGFHLKWPWPIGIVRRFDHRIQLFDPPAREVFTSDKKNVTVAPYVCWRIARAMPETPISERPIVRFFRGLGTMDAAPMRLETRLRSAVSSEVGHVELGQLLSRQDSETGPDENAEGPLEQIARRIRQQMERRPHEEQALVERLGIEIVDVRIKRLNLPSGNQQAVFERMKSERRKIADRYRSAGMAESRVIRSHADRQYGEILARAEADAERVRGEAEAEALRILNGAHERDPELYRFLATLDAYQTLFGENTTILLSSTSPMLRLFSQGLDQHAPSKSIPPAAESTPTSTDPPPPLLPTAAAKVATEVKTRQQAPVIPGDGGRKELPPSPNKPPKAQP